MSVLPERRTGSEGILEALDDRTRAELTRRSVMRSFGPGTVLWAAGDENDGLYVVTEGKVRILRARAGRQYLVHTAGPGECMGEVPLFDGGTYPATAVAAEPTKCLVIGRESLEWLMKERPSVTWFLLEGLSRRVRQLVEALQRNTVGTVRSRLAASLLGLATVSRDGVVVVDMTQHQWAEDLGTVREVLARELRWLKARRTITQVGARRYRIDDEAALEEMCLER